MKISRWIYIPLIVALTWALTYLIFGFIGSFREFLVYLIIGAIFGFVMQFLSYLLAKKVSGKDNDEEIHKVRQNRKVTLLLDYEKSFDLCREAIHLLNPSKIKKEDFENGMITARTRINWKSFGTIINLELKKINQNLTEVEISTRPIPRTVLVDYGEGWKYANEICNYLKSEDSEINKNLLVESASILDNVYVKPFQKETVKR